MRQKDFRPAGRAVAFMFAVFAAMAWRRPDQFLHPYLWVEEGTVFIPQLLQSGWRFLFQPVAGYILLPSKIIFLAAAKISFSNLPQIAYWLTVLFEWSVCLAVAASPTYLRKPTLCAIALLLLPIDSEVYAVTGYAFWFGTILLFLGLLWREDALDRVKLRAAFVFVGGFSSPMVVPLCIFFAWRSLRANDRREDTITATTRCDRQVPRMVCLLSGGRRHRRRICHRTGNARNHGRRIAARREFWPLPSAGDLRNVDRLVGVEGSTPVDFRFP
jgi:hypothetical protein